MSVINSHDLMTSGISSIEAALAKDPIAVITDCACRFVVMSLEKYRYLQECELLTACAEGRADIAAGNFSIDSPERHVEKLR